MDRPALFVLASYMRDVSVMVDRCPVAGESRPGRDALEAPGGKGSNQAVQAALCGAAVSIAAAIGTDAAGDAAWAMWAAQGLDTAAVIRVAGQPTGQAVIIVEDSGENRIVFAPGANRHLRAADIDPAAGRIACSELVITQLESPLSASLRAFELARAAGVRTVLNAAPAPSGPLEPLGPLLELTDIVVANEIEAAMLSGLPLDVDPLQAGTQLLERVRQAAVVTLGARGAIVWQRGAPAVHLLPPAVRVVDSTGAGDAFVGAFATQLARTGDLTHALRAGVSAGALACTQRGCVPAFAMRSDIEARLEDIVAA